MLTIFHITIRYFDDGNGKIDLVSCLEAHRKLLPTLIKGHLM